MWTQFMEAWKEGIYQKTPKIDLTFQYGGEISRGKKFEITLKKEMNNKIMKEPIMTEKKLLEIVNRQRSRKTVIFPLSLCYFATKFQDMVEKTTEIKIN